MSKLSLCAATALSLAACTCAAGTPINIARGSTIYAHDGGPNYPGAARALCPGRVCDIAFASLAEGTRKPAGDNSTAMFWWEEALAAHRVAWSSEMLGPFVTIDFRSTVNVRSRTVWADRAPGSREGSESYQAPLGGTRFAIPATLNWSGRAYTFSGPNLISTTVDVQFTHAPSDWDSVRRVTFDSSNGSGAQRPAAGLLVAGVLITVGSLGRRRVNFRQG